MDSTKTTEEIAMWYARHSDAFHPATRDECHHCQIMIEAFGPMPSVNEILSIPNPRPKTPNKQSIPSELRWMVWERDDFTCRCCGARRNLSVDHIHPESKGGTTNPNNLQTLCRSCNSRKGTRV